ncbi:hypothetical protein NIES267_13650 [Calothrix parasitica NIES-267]|uniref:Uncharacterized protein n=1 Tax=Calothrix parasitica NIES-267 TaxID=1973488 RepID=A0A1Z4LKX2_9CYAN|nr:hypothetical protein NIES267_13650 [Calothrix parasitica NIES-267]
MGRYLIVALLVANDFCRSKHGEGGLNKHDCKYQNILIIMKQVLLYKRQTLIIKFSFAVFGYYYILIISSTRLRHLLFEISLVRAISLTYLA